MIRVTIVITAIALVLCTSVNDFERDNSQIVALLESNLNSITNEMQSMYNEVRPWLLYDPPIYIAFADIDFDGIPEFFYGYQTLTSSLRKIWYRAFSLRDNTMIEHEHIGRWNIYITEDVDSSFFSSSNIFLAGYFLDNETGITLVSEVSSGPVTDLRNDFCLIRYDNGRLLITVESAEIDAEFREPLTPIKQVWVELQGDNLRDDILALLQDYNNL